MLKALVDSIPKVFILEAALVSFLRPFWSHVAVDVGISVIVEMGKPHEMNGNGERERTRIQRDDAILSLKATE